MNFHVLRRCTMLMVAFLAALLVAACTDVITTQPKSQTVNAGQTATFTVVLSVPAGTPVSYQWLRNGVAIPGATAGSYSFVAQTADNNARFSVKISGGGKCETSASATLTVIANNPGSISILAGQLGGLGNLVGSGSTVRIGRPQATAVDSSGNVYVADGFNNAILRISTTGAITTLAGSNMLLGSGSADGSGNAARFLRPSGIAIDGSGNLYVADTGNNTIRKVTPAGVVTTLAGSAGMSGSDDGSGAAARFNNPQGIAIDSSGNLYVADTMNMLIRKITPAGVVTTLAGTVGFPGGDDGTGTAASFNSPQGIAVDSSGYVFVADTNNSTIRRISPSGNVVTFAGTAGVTGTSDGTGAGASFNAPSAIVIDSTGTLFVADTYNHSIRRITAGGVTTTLLGVPGVPGSNDGTWGSSHLNQPTGLSLDASGALYIADANNSTVRKAAANAVTTIAGKPPVLGAVDGTGSSASFRTQAAENAFLASPQIATDSAGNVYVADTFNNTIRKVTPAGVVTTLAGAAGMAGSADGSGAAARFNNPMGIAVDAGGNVFVADTNNNTVRKITPAGVVTTLAGTAGIIGAADGSGASAGFYNPQGIAVDGTGNLYVTDTFNFTVRKVTPAGVVTTLAGTAGVYGDADGTGNAASFGAPAGITVDATGTVYITDINYNTVRKITATGVVTTIAGTSGICGSADGTGTAATFCSPEAITLDAAGNLYVADMLNAELRKITPAGVVSTVAGTAGIEGLVTGTVATGSLNLVGGIGVDASGTLYTMSENAVIRIVPASAGTIPPTPAPRPCNQPCHLKWCQLRFNCWGFIDCDHHDGNHH